MYLQLTQAGQYSLAQHCTALQTYAHAGIHTLIQYSMTSEMGTSPLSGLWPAKDCPGESCSLLSLLLECHPS